MADKPILTYRVDSMSNPADRDQTIYVPRLTQRATRTTSLATIVENAIDRGLIAGLKPSAAQGVADALAQQMYKEFCLGNNIAFGSYFHGQLFLDGTCETAAGPLTAANSINIRLYKGTDFKLSRDSFSFTLDDGLEPPRVDTVIGADNIAGHIVNDANFNLVGVNFGEAQGTVTIRDEGGNTNAAQIVGWGPNNVVAKVSLPDGELGKAVTVTVTTGGETPLVATAKATIVAAE